MSDSSAENKDAGCHTVQDLSSLREGSIGDVEAVDASPSPVHGLRRNFTSRHIQMICFGGCLGSGMFIGLGKALHYGGGPAIIIGYGLICTLALLAMNVLTENTCLFPTTGSFIDHAARFIDPSLAFAIAFCEWASWSCTVAAEAAVVRVVLTYWTESLPTAACMTIYLAIVYFVHAMPTRFFAEFEFATAALKVIAMFIILFACIAIMAGAGPTGSTHHLQNFRELPLFPNGFKGVSQTFALAAWATGGQEIMGISAGESRRPRWDMPRACVNLFYRIAFFFLLATVFVSVLVPYDDERLLTTSTVASSPFVIAMNDAGIRGLPDMMNVIIIIGLIAIGGEGLYISSRVLIAMAQMKMLPQILARCDARGRPTVALFTTSIVATILTYINCSNTGAIIFTWFSSVSATTYFLAWMIIAMTNVQMRRAIKAQDDPAWKMPYAFRLPAFPATAVALFVLSFFVLFCTGYVSLFPIGAQISAKSFFQTFLGVPIFLSVYLAHKLWYRGPLLCNPAEADLKTGRRDLTVEDIAFLEAYYAQPMYKRALSYVTF